MAELYALQPRNSVSKGTTGRRNSGAWSDATTDPRLGEKVGIHIKLVPNSNATPSAVYAQAVEYREARLAKWNARNEVLRVRVEQREAALAAAGPALTVEQAYRKAVVAALRGEDLHPSTAPEARQCTECGAVKAINEFYSALVRGKREYKTKCKQCHANKYNSVKREATALRQRVAEIDAASRTCLRCDQKRPPILFQDGNRYCYPCQVEVLEAEKAALLERVPTGDDWARERRARYRHSNPKKAAERSAKRLDRLMKQADGTMTRDAVGRLFGQAEGKPCPYCGAMMDRKTKSLDHMIPVSRGGLHSVVNAIICCLRCNTRKGNQDFCDWLCRLEEPFASMMAAEYARRYGAPPVQAVFKLQFAPEMLALN